MPKPKELVFPIGDGLLVIVTIMYEEKIPAEVKDSLAEER